MGRPDFPLLGGVWFLLGLVSGLARSWRRHCDPLLWSLGEMRGKRLLLEAGLEIYGEKLPVRVLGAVEHPGEMISLLIPSQGAPDARAVGDCRQQRG